MQVAKELDSGFSSENGPPAVRQGRRAGNKCGENSMTTKTCAACDCELDSDPIIVTIGGDTVEVCCQECAIRLKEAHASAPAQD